MGMVPELKEYIQECCKRFITNTDKKCIRMGADIWGNTSLVKPFPGEVCSVDFWEEFSERVDEFLNQLPKDWWFKSDQHNVCMGPDTTMIQERECEYIIFKKSFNEVLNVMKKPYLECSTGIAMLYLMAVRFIKGEEWVAKKLDVLDCIWFSTWGVNNNSPMMRLFRCSEVYPIFLFNTTKQKKLVNAYPVGTYLYIRGVYMWLLVSAYPKLGELMHKCGLSASFQGENVMVIGPNKLVGFWQDPDTHKAAYSVKTLQNIMSNLKKRFMAEYNRLPGEKQKQIMDMANYVMQNATVDEIKYTDPFQVVGITNAIRYSLLQ